MFSQHVQSVEYTADGLKHDKDDQQKWEAPRAGVKTAVLPDDSGVELPGVQVDHSERGRGEAFTETC